jgi:hypothetical protein
METKSIALIIIVILVFGGGALFFYLIGIHSTCSFEKLVPTTLTIDDATEKLISAGFDAEKWSDQPTIYIYMREQHDQHMTNIYLDFESDGININGWDSGWYYLPFLSKERKSSILNILNSISNDLDLNLNMLDSDISCKSEYEGFLD